MEKMDKLFSEKFVNYEKAAPSGAWTKIENKLDRRDNKFLWLKIAAGISVLAIASILIVRTSADHSENISHNDKKVSPGSNEQKSNATPVVEQPTIAEQPVTQNESKEQKSIPGQQKKSQQVNTETMRSVATVENEQTGNKKAEENTQDVAVEGENTTPVTENAVAIVEETPVEEPVRVTDNAITLVYSAEEVNSKYLNKDQHTEATSDDKKPSTLRKLLEKAYDLKHNQDPFGELRQRKNEILALNFKNEKERSQNR